MSYDDLLINTAVLERYTFAALDAYGRPEKDWAHHLTVPCRLSTAALRRWRQEQSGTEVVPVDAILFVQDIDVTEADRVTVDGVLYEIGYVERHQDGDGWHHKELALRRVKP